MAISSDKYVRIVTAAAGAESVPTQALHLRRFTDNPLIPYGAVLEFDQVSAIAYFGADSKEAIDVNAYFGYTSPAPASKASRIQFAAWPRTARVPTVYGAKLQSSLVSLQAITSGSLTLSLGGGLEEFAGLDFSAAVTLADIASSIQTKLRTSISTQFVGATVSFDAIRGAFVIAGTVAEDAAVEVSTGTTAAALGLIGSSAIYSNGSAAKSTLQAYIAALELSDNYGPASFRWPAGYSPDLEADVIPLAQFVAGENCVHRLDWAVPRTQRSAWMAAVAGIGYNSWNDVSDGNPVEIMPSAITAATNFARRNGAVGYMYRQNGALTATVDDTMLASELDQLKINYIGRTMSAGASIDFYQQGVLTGGASDLSALNVQANEMWLKARCKAALLNLQLNSGILSADIDGEGAIYAVLSGGPIGEALFNGVISVGKRLTTLQQQAIYEITGDPLASIQVETTGWWLEVRAQGNAAQYTLVYAVADQIRRIDGSHNLI
jgi:hypothetical protein